MRKAFIQALMGLAEADSRVWLVGGDLGFSVLEPFMERFSDRYLNAGVAEQNMLGVASGLALAGKTVFVYSIANFPVVRCLEQVRNDVCYHGLNVKVVAVGGGYAYSSLGYTHHGVEDLALMRVLPGMTVLAPGDPSEAAWATLAAAALQGPCYLRLGRGGEPAVHPEGTEFELGRAVLVRPGKDLTLISCGAVLKLALEAAERLAMQNLQARVLSCHTLWPLDRQSILDCASQTRLVVTVEEHGLGGLGTAVAEILAEAGLPAGFRAVRLPREPVRVSGSQSYLCARQGLSLDNLMRTVLETL